jgi:hypothetical protein
MDLLNNFIGVDKKTNIDAISNIDIFDIIFVNLNITDRYNCLFLSKKLRKVTEYLLNRPKYSRFWTDIVYVKKLPDNFIRKYVNKLNIFSLLDCQKLSEPILDILIDKIDSCYILWKQKHLSEAFLERHLQKFDIDLLLKHQKVSEDFIIRRIRIKNMTSHGFNTMIENYGISSWFCDTYLHYININHIYYTVKLTDKFIQKHKDKLNWCMLCLYQKLTPETINKCIDEIQTCPSQGLFWRHLSKFQQLTEDFIHDHADKLYWYYICKHQNLSETFIIDHKDYID